MLALALGAAFTALPVAARSDKLSIADTVKQIDTQCLAIQNAIMALKPAHLEFLSSKWLVISDSDYTVAERTHAAVTLVNAWKQGDNYAWIHSHSFNAAGDQRATQLCYRQSDGTLARARQATSVPDLDGTSAQTAYFTNGGALIQKTALFEMNDPAVAKKVTSLGYYSVLP